MKRILITFLLFIPVFYFSKAQPLQRGIRVSYYISDAQIAFINSHYNYLITPFLSQEIRDEITGPKLLLYRSIQGTWEDFDQFDWNFITSNENMFCHSDSAVQDTTTRIITIWGSWLMDGNDLVDISIPDAMKHWVNYYAVTASGQVIAFGYDGLFIDSAGHKLSPGAVYGIMPWDYSDESWRDGRYAALSFIKSYLPDNQVIFNGLHSGNGADSSLNFTDGGMWEDFTYDINDGHYKGLNKWLAAINCLNTHKDSSSLVLVVKKPGLKDDMQARIFSTASFLLVTNENTVLSLSDYTYNTSIQFYPEYEIDLGAPLGDLEMTDDSLFIRRFENGISIVNPLENETKTFEAGAGYFEVVPAGGGIIDTTGYYDGYLTYRLPDSSSIDIPPVSAVILIDTTAVGIKEVNTAAIFSVKNPWPNPFHRKINIEMNLRSSGFFKIEVYNMYGNLIRTLHNGILAKGLHIIRWDGTSRNGKIVPRGMYVIRISSPQRTVQKKVLLQY